MSLSRRSYLLILAASAGLILWAGVRLRPSDAPSNPGTSEAELSRLLQMARRRAAEDLATFFSSVAERAGPSLLRVTTTGLTGIAWSPETVVTARHGPRLPDVVSVEALTGELEGRTAGRGPYLELASVRIADEVGQPVERGATDLVRPGDWVVAVWETDDGLAFASGHFVELVSVESYAGFDLGEVRSTVTLADDMAGGGLFDLDGRLVGLIAVHDGRLMALAVESIDAVLAQAETLEVRLLDRFGFRVDVPTDEEADHLRAESGFVVREVWDGSLAQGAGLRPGDVITAVNDDEAIDLAQFAALVEDGLSGPVTLGVHWRGAPREVPLVTADVIPESSDDTEPEMPPGLSWGPGGYQVDAVMPGSRAAVAGITPGDRLLAIDRVEPGSLAQVDRIVRGQRAATAFLEFRRGARRWGVLF